MENTTTVRCLFCPNNAFGSYHFSEIICCENCFEKIETEYQKNQKSKIQINGKTGKKRKHTSKPEIIYVLESEEEPEPNPKRQKEESELTSDELKNLYEAIFIVMTQSITNGVFDIERLKEYTKIALTAKNVRGRFFNPKWRNDNDTMTLEVQFNMKFIEEFEDNPKPKTIHLRTHSLREAYGFLMIKKRMIEEHNFEADTELFTTTELFALFDQLNRYFVSDFALVRQDKRNNRFDFVVYPILTLTVLLEKAISLLTSEITFAQQKLHSVDFFKWNEADELKKTLDMIRISRTNNGIVSANVKTSKYIQYTQFISNLHKLLPRPPQLISEFDFEPRLSQLGVFYYANWIGYIKSMSKQEIDKKIQETSFFATNFKFNPLSTNIIDLAIVDLLLSSGIEIDSFPMSKFLSESFKKNVQSNYENYINTLTLGETFEKNIVNSYTFTDFIALLSLSLSSIPSKFVVYPFGKIVQRSTYDLTTEIYNIKNVLIFGGLKFLCLPSILNFLKTTYSANISIFEIFLKMLRELIVDFIDLIYKRPQQKQIHYLTFKNLIIDRQKDADRKKQFLRSLLKNLIIIHQIWTTSIDPNALWFVKTGEYLQRYFGEDETELFQKLDNLKSIDPEP